MAVNTETAVDRPLRDLGLWLGILGPPAVWLIQFQTIYMLVYPACGAQRNFVIHITCFIFLVAITALGVSPLRTWRDAPRSDERTNRTRRFMGIVGGMSTALFLLLVIAQWIAAFIVDPCPM
jgi:hypothetical protein